MYRYKEYEIYTVSIMYQPLVMFYVEAYEITLTLPGVSCEMCHGLVEAVLSRQYTETVSSVKKKPKSNNKNV